jgi:hypothetical protein
MRRSHRALIKACLLLALEVFTTNANAQSACAYLLGWSVSRRSPSAVLMKESPTPNNYVVFARKGKVKVTYKSASASANGATSTKEGHVAAPNSLILRDATSIEIRHEAWLPAHGSLRICKRKS